MLKKIPLHFQILLALVFAIIYGSVFPTKYILDNKKIIELTKTYDPLVIAKLDTIQGKEYRKRNDFKKDIQKLLINEKSKDIETVISIAYENKPVKYVSWMGEIFLRALKMVVILLVISSLINGVTNLGNSKNLGRISLKTIIYYLSTSLLAILTGLFLVNFIKPGKGANIILPDSLGGFDLEKKPIGETLIEIIPENPFNALLKGDMLSIIFFSLLFGYFITVIDKQKSKVLIEFFSSIFDTMMRITLFIIKFAPIGIFGLVALEISKQENLGSLIESLGLFMLTVLLGLFIHAFITLPIIIKSIGKVNPFLHFKAQITTLFTAFSTASSNATLPITIESVEDNSGVSNKISSFTLPLGATINMDGTALYELVVAGFIAQLYGFDLSITEQFILVVTALLASIGTAAVPMASLVTMTIVFSAIGLPLSAIAIILPVDRPLDMFRTATNVWSDTCGAVTIAKSEGEQLKV